MYITGDVSVLYNKINRVLVNSLAKTSNSVNPLEIAGLKSICHSKKTRWGLGT